MKTILPLVLFILLPLSSTHAQWTLSNNGLSNPGVFAFTLIGENVYVGTNTGVDFTTDNAASWSSKLSGTPPVISLATDGTNIFAGTEGEGIYRSTDAGNTWEPVDSGLTSNQVFSLLIYGTQIFAGTIDGGVFLSTDNGDSWTLANTGLPANAWVHSLIISGNILFAGTDDDGIYHSMNSGASWSPVNSGLSNHNVRALFPKDGKIYAGTDGGGIFISSDNGTTWAPANTGLTNLDVRSFTSAQEKVFAATDGGGVFVSGDNGATWTAINDGFLSFGIGFSLGVNSTTIFSAMYSEGVYTRSLDEVTATSINSVAAFISIFPNPTQGELNMHLNSEKEFSIALYNALGEIVCDQTLTGKANRMDISSYTPGIYFYRMSSQSATVCGKVIKE